MDATRLLLQEMLARRLEAPQREWLAERAAEIGHGVSSGRFATLISLASRYAPRDDLEPLPEELDRAGELLPGWSPERWSLLETLRVALVLARPDLDEPPVVEAAFQYADEGELCALHRALALLPRGERFLPWALEGCRTNIVPVFEAVACDTPYPARFFEDLPWRQLVIKAVFIGAPLWRVSGLDDRLSPELARMALDLADERRSAGREVQHELWLCLGSHGGERGLASLEREVASANERGRRAALLGLARAGQRQRLQELLTTERDPSAAKILQQALDGDSGQLAFRALDPGTTRR